jgi:AcrR family transcriptional regulator
MARSSKKSDLLRVAGTVILRDGIAALTFDRLAAEAGVSKGGLLYHFPDKDRLLSALVEGIVAMVDLAIAYQIVADTRSSERGRWLRAYIRAAFATGDETDRLRGMLRAGLPPDSPALARLTAADRRWRDAACADGLPRGVALAIHLAVDGTFVTRLDPGDAAAARDSLLALTAP